MQWGCLYNPNADGKPEDYESKIKALQGEINKLRIPRMTTLSQASYKNVTAYKEWHDHKRRSLVDKVKEVDLEDLGDLED